MYNMKKDQHYFLILSNSHAMLQYKNYKSL